ncbi:hypothetical protein NOV72_05416 [Caballeronia novacaledonica]|uniref:SnoaL-like domain-containing protein n=1 Tax=Caballeronia novacaledonica TaxID=1544861 RepID=A0A2U3IDC1_9BURK|nr:nuclear transport factor 2 family protein [Caballeronia novacaledonica]SPB18217.1 hypothetical protein NOV72_05416 [Caballeronia novacaledonica]
MEHGIQQTLQQLVDKAAIYDVMCRYARGVDRGDWELLRSAYHADAYDDHVDFKGNVDGLIAWLQERFAGVDNSTHFLGNFLVEFAGPDLALVETYYASRRLRAPSEREAADLAAGDALCRQSWGRYVDRFERRNGEWRVANRIVVIDSRFTSVARGGMRDDGDSWGMRDRSDPIHVARAELFR